MIKPQLDLLRIFENSFGKEEAENAITCLNSFTMITVDQIVEKHTTAFRHDIKDQTSAFRHDLENYTSVFRHDLESSNNAFRHDLENLEARMQRDVSKTVFNAMSMFVGIIVAIMGIGVSVAIAILK